MSNETDRLEREAELHRRRLDSTLAEIESKFSPGAIVDELSGYLRDGQGATMARNLSRQVRDNPLALGVIGAGVAWLLMGKGVRRSASTVRERYQDWRQHDRQDDTQYERSEYATSDQNQSYARRYEERDPPRRMNLEEDRPMSQDGNGSGDYGDFPGAGEASGEDGRARSYGTNEGSSDHSVLHDARDRVSGVASNVREKLHGTTEKASQAAHSAGRWTTNRMHETQEAGQRALRAARRGSRFAGHEGRRLARQGGDQLMTAMREQPLVVGAVIIAIGAAIGAALPSTRKEDELMGKTRDRLKEKAGEFGNDVVDRASHVAKTAMQAADEKAGEVGLKPEGGETIADKVATVAEAAVDAAKQDAEKQGLL